MRFLLGFLQISFRFTNLTHKKIIWKICILFSYEFFFFPTPPGVAAEKVKNPTTSLHASNVGMLMSLHLF